MMTVDDFGNVSAYPLGSISHVVQAREKYNEIVRDAALAEIRKTDGKTKGFSGIGLWYCHCHIYNRNAHVHGAGLLYYQPLFRTSQHIPVSRVS